MNLPATLHRWSPNVRQSLHPNRARALRLPCGSSGAADGGGLLDQRLGTWAKPGLVALILAGTSTVGRQAATEHIHQEDSLEELLQRTNLTNGSNVPPFVVLLRLQVTHYVPMQDELVIVRKSRKVAAALGTFALLLFLFAQR